MESSPLVGFFAIFSLLQLISTGPIWLLIYDGYKENNVKKGIFYILGFFAFISIGIILITIFGIWLAVVTPLLLPIFLLMSQGSK